MSATALKAEAGQQELPRIPSIPKKLNAARKMPKSAVTSSPGQTQLKGTRGFREWASGRSSGALPHQMVKVPSESITQRAPRVLSLPGLMEPGVRNDRAKKCCSLSSTLVHEAPDILEVQPMEITKNSSPAVLSQELLRFVPVAIQPLNESGPAPRMPDGMKNPVQIKCRAAQIERMESVPTVLSSKHSMRPSPRAILLPIAGSKPPAKQASLTSSVVAPGKDTSAPHLLHSGEKSAAEDDVEMCFGTIKHFAESVVGHSASIVGLGEPVENAVAVAPGRTSTYPTIGSKSYDGGLACSEEAFPRQTNCLK